MYGALQNQGDIVKFLLALLFCFSVAWAADQPAPGTMTMSGKVLETKDVEGYTYLRLKTANGEQWAAVNKAPVKVGADVTIENANVMTNFESKTLKKKFDRIVFGTLAGSAPDGGDMAAMHAGVSKPAADVGDVKVAKATGPDARTIAEIVAKRTELKDKNIVVRGKVVKYTPSVMGKNWIHLRDGTGSAKDSTDDLTVTTNDSTKVGDVVLVKGIVHTDRDLGSGYSYKVLIEEAKLEK
jgi:hypothetical protein